MLGNRKPLLRSVPSGNDIHGRYSSGTPMKSTCASRPVPILLRVSRTMLCALIFQLSSLSGQVVKVTPLRLMTPCGVSFSSCAEPRPARCRSSNWAWRKSAPAAAE